MPYLRWDNAFQLVITGLDFVITGLDFVITEFDFVITGLDPVIQVAPRCRPFLVFDWIAAPGSEAGASFAGMTTSSGNDPTGWVVGQFEWLQPVRSLGSDAGS
jgi:hypothetical protein